MASNDGWWRNDRNSGGWSGGERAPRGGRDYGRDMLNDMRRYARGGYGNGEGERSGYGSGDRHRAEQARAEPGRMDYGRMDYGRGGHYGDHHGGNEGRGDRGFFERAGDEMASWFGDEDAERRRRLDAWGGDSGAQHHRGRGPRGYTRSDGRIREDISDRLTDDPYVDASDIELTVDGGEVTLTGLVEDRRTKRRAEDIAESVSGVRNVQNNLRLRGMSNRPLAGEGADTAPVSGGIGAPGGAEAASATPRARDADDSDTRTTGVVGDMNAPATLHTADTNSLTRR